MPNTTIDSIRLAAPHLSSVSDSALSLYMKDAALDVAALNPPEEQRERLERYLAIHFASVKSQHVVKEKMDVLEKQYAVPTGEGILSTPYGMEYDRLLGELGLKPANKKSGLNLMVL